MRTFAKKAVNGRQVSYSVLAQSTSSCRSASSALVGTVVTVSVLPSAVKTIRRHMMVYKLDNVPSTKPMLR